MIAIDPWFEGVKIVVFREGSLREFVPQSSSSWGTCSLQMAYGGNVDDSSP